MATIENEGLETKAAAAEDQYIFTMSVGITAETPSSERYLMAACKRDGFVLTQAQLTHSAVSARTSLLPSCTMGFWVFSAQNHIYSRCAVNKWLISSCFGGEQQKWETEKKRLSSQMLLTSS